jgi:hypothetical protein
VIRMPNESTVSSVTSCCHDPIRTPIYDTTRPLHQPLLRPKAAGTLPTCKIKRQPPPSYSTTSHTNSKHSLVILTPSSTTFFGNAKLCPFSPFPFRTSSSFFFPVFVPFGVRVLEEVEVRSRSSVSDFMSERTRDMSAGKVVQSPERRRERAWF